MQTCSDRLPSSNVAATWHGSRQVAGKGCRLLPSKDLFTVLCLSMLYYVSACCRHAELSKASLPSCLHVLLLLAGAWACRPHLMNCMLPTTPILTPSCGSWQPWRSGGERCGSSTLWQQSQGTSTRQLQARGTRLLLERFGLRFRSNCTAVLAVATVAAVATDKFAPHLFNRIYTSLRSCKFGHAARLLPAPTQLSLGPLSGGWARLKRPYLLVNQHMESQQARNQLVHHVREDIK